MRFSVNGKQRVRKGKITILCGMKRDINKGGHENVKLFLIVANFYYTPSSDSPHQKHWR